MLDQIARIRRFNRAVTREVGALETSFLGRGRPLGMARVLWTISPEGTDVALIRETLDLDSGLLSRILRSLEAQNLIEVTSDPSDRRRRIARLTDAGQAERAAYDTLNTDRAGRILAMANRQGDQLLAAMDLIATVLNRNHVTIRSVDPDRPRGAGLPLGLFQSAGRKDRRLQPEPLSAARSRCLRLPRAARRLSGGLLRRSSARLRVPAQPVR